MPWRVGTVSAIAGAALVFLLVQSLILNGFYHHGAYFLDSGWFAYSAWRTDALLTAPESHPWGAVPYLRQHVSLFLVALNAISHILPVSHVSYFAIWMAGIYASGFFVGRTITLQGFRSLDLNSTASNLVSTAVGVFFAFSGVGLATLLYPHPEIAIGFAISGALLAHANGDRRLAIALILLTLTLRTDAGLHIGIFLGAMAGARLFQSGFKIGDKEFGQLVGAAFLCAGASVVLYLLQAIVLPGGSQFRSIYSGDPAFAHVTPALLAERLSLYFSTRLYALVGFASCLVAFGLTRRWIFLFGFLAGLPWLLINLVALSDSAGTLFTYYAFPFVVLLAWPGIFLGSIEKIGQRGAVFVVFIAGVLASTVLLLNSEGSGRILGEVALKAPPVEYRMVEELALGVVSRIPQEGMEVDGAVLSLQAHNLRRGALFFPSLPADRKLDTLVFFETYMDTAAIREEAGRRGIGIECSRAPTPIRILTSDEAHANIAEGLGFSCVRPPPAIVTPPAPAATGPAQPS